MTKDADKPRHDPVTLVGPFARVRIVVAVAIFCVAFIVIGYRLFLG